VRSADELETISTENEHVLAFMRTHAGKRAVILPTSWRVYNLFLRTSSNNIPSKLKSSCLGSASFHFKVISRSSHWISRSLG